MNEETNMVTMKHVVYEVSVMRHGKMRPRTLHKKEFPETFRQEGDILFLDVNGQQRPALITKVIGDYVSA